ncbi:SAM-dependent methyltransferase [Labilithrix luteola]|uniref:SAM-dependent methyltransferase n=2 Tax=Labilithrix luteola TaxID=1391654 RepID=A0A0K1PMS3_9BACT|nr:SAM-dependent methyltransferase [Labilithrix luteola]
MISRPCPLCADTDDSRVFAKSNFDFSALDAFAFASRKLPEYMHYRLVECPICDVLYASPVPTDSELSQAYHEAAFDSREEARFAAQVYGSFLPRIRSRLPDTRGALDIGAGDGAFLEELLDAGFTDVVGVEPSAAPIASASPRVQPLLKQGFFRADDYAASSFALITCFQTLEHLSDPIEMCRAAQRLLKPGGAMFVIAHDRRSLSARVLGTKSPIFDIEHLQLFSPDSARQLLERAGFTDVELDAVVNRYPLHYWAKLFPFPKPVKLPLVRALKQSRVGTFPLQIPAGNLAAIGWKRSANA